eukprot:6976191-Prymnesium_polylepis.1
MNASQDGGRVLTPARLADAQGTSQDVAEMIDADVQALIWAHVPEFDVEAEGTEFNNRRWTTKGAAYLPH